MSSLRQLLQSPLLLLSLLSIFSLSNADAQPSYFHSPSQLEKPPAGPTQGPENPVDDRKPAAVLDELVDSAATIRPLSESLSWNVAPRGMSLHDAIQISLSKSEVVRTLGSSGVQIEAVTGYDPALKLQAANVSATVFDPKLTAGYVGSRINEPSGTFFGPGIPQNVRRDEGDFIASVSKSWATGATTSIGYLPPLGYLFYPLGVNNGFNPIYTSDLVVTATQPLMRGAGWTVNMAPIRIAQLKTEQSVWDCKQAVLGQVRSVESAYWDLQAALVSLDALESVLPLMSEVVRIEGQRARLEMSTIADVARASMQFDALQQQRVQARNDAIAKELRLRNLLADQLWDGSRIVPTDLPRSAPVTFDHATAMENSLQQRPDLVRQRIGVRIREMEYAVAKNGIKPQLDLQALYRSNGIGQQLNTSLQQMMNFQYNDWTVGATFSIPLGNRAARATLNGAELQLVRDRAVLNQSIQNIGFTLSDMIRESEAAFSQFELALRRVQNSREWIRSARTRYSTPPPSDDGNQNWLLLALYDYQNALRMHVDATTDAAQFLARYNTQLAKFEEAQGVLLVNRGIEWNDDPCVIVKAQSARVFGTAEAPPGPPAPMSLPSSAYGAGGPANIPPAPTRPAPAFETVGPPNPATAPAVDSRFSDVSARFSSDARVPSAQPYPDANSRISMPATDRYGLPAQPYTLTPPGHSIEARRRWSWPAPVAR